MDKYIYNGLIRTYASACKRREVTEKHIQMYLKDIWQLVERMEDEGVDMNLHILNGITEAYCSSHQPDELFADVLPLYEKNQLAPDRYTYLSMTSLYHDLRQTDNVIETYERMLEQKITPTVRSMNHYLRASMMNHDTERVTCILETFVEENK